MYSPHIRSYRDNIRRQKLTTAEIHTPPTTHHVTLHTNAHTKIPGGSTRARKQHTCTMKDRRAQLPTNTRHETNRRGARRIHDVRQTHTTPDLGTRPLRVKRACRTINRKMKQRNTEARRKGRVEEDRRVMHIHTYIHALPPPARKHRPTHTYMHSHHPRTNSTHKHTHMLMHLIPHQHTHTSPIQLAHNDIHTTFSTNSTTTRLQHVDDMHHDMR